MQRIKLVSLYVILLRRLSNKLTTLLGHQWHLQFSHQLQMMVE